MTLRCSPRRLAALLFGGLSAVLPLSAAPLITEFAASNNAGLKDADGSFSDWLEIYNPDAIPVDLTGWTLTDDITQTTRWTFPATTLAPGAYLVVFASGKDRAVSGGELHTNFSLSAGGEYLGLYPPGSATPASDYAPAFPGQTANVSYGLLGLTADSGRAFFTTPTPGTVNVPANAPAEAVGFSLSSRTFTMPDTLTLSLTKNSPTATIRYTLDRKVPDANSPVYTAPLTISTSTRVRARAFEPGRPDGPVASETFLQLDAAAASFTSNLPIVLTHNFNAGTIANDAVVPSVIMVFQPKSPDNLARMTDLPAVATPCSLERRGSTTASALKYSMTLELWDETNDDRDFPLAGMPADSDWVLQSPYEYDRSLIHNDLIYRLSNDCGRYAPRTKFVEHFHNTANGTVNGALTGSVDYFGVYSLQERIKRGSNRVDVEKITPTDNTAPAVQGGYIFKIDRTGTDSGIAAAGYTSGTGSVGLVWVDPKETSTDPTQVVSTAQKTYVKTNLDAMWAAMNAGNFMDPEAGYAKYLDVIPTVDNHILNTASRNLDALRLSAYWHKSRYGKWTAGPIWDADRAMGSIDPRENSPALWTANFNAGAGDFGTDFFHVKWYKEMFKDPNFWQTWVDRLDILRNSGMSTAHVTAVIQEMTAELAPPGAGSTPASRNFARWTAVPPRAANAATPGTNGTWAGEIAWLTNWWTQRLAFMDGQFTRPAEASPAAGVVAVGSSVSLASPSTSTSGVRIFYTTDGSDPRPAATAPYPAAGQMVSTPVMSDISPVRAIVPDAALDAAIGTTWRGSDANANGNNADDFDDSAWYANAAGSLNGVGYDDAASPVNFIPLLGLRLSSTANPVAPNLPSNRMIGNNSVVYTRLPFSLSAAQAASFGPPANLTLSVRYDDGFTAWLNGVQVATAASPATLAWNGLATAARADADAAVYKDFDISAFANLLHEGVNVLAVQGFNSSVASNDAIIGCKIVSLSAAAAYVPPVAASAMEYTAPIPVSVPTVLTVRTLNPVLPTDPPTTAGGGTGAVPNGTGWSAIRKYVYLPGAEAASVANVFISEVLYHPPTPTAAEVSAGFDKANNFEFIRITNKGATPVDLTGMSLVNGGTFSTPLELRSWLPPGASAVIVGNEAAWRSRYGTLYPVLGKFSGDLSDGGEKITLVGRDGLPISSFTYTDDPPWPQAADEGRSLIYSGSGDPALGTSWQASLDPGGSGVSSFASWQSRYFPGGGAASDPISDADGDGVINFFEYTSGTDPLVADSNGALSIDSATPLTLSTRCRKVAPGIRWTLESSTTGSDWETISDAPTLQPLDANTVRRVWQLTPEGDRHLYRLQVTAP